MSLKNKIQKHKFITGLIVFLVWIGVWAMAARSVNQELLIPSPAVVARHLVSIVRDPGFFKIIGTSLLRVLGGFVSGCLLGVLLAVLCGVSAALDALLYPIVRIISSVPVTSFIILVMLWIAYTYVPVFIAALLVTPIVFGNVRTGIQETDPQLLEVAKMYRFGRLKTLKIVYIPSVLPYFYSGALTALGLAWKAGIAAEVLALPKNAIGSGMYYSKLYLETGDLFAWTVIVVIFSFFFEKLMQAIMKRRKRKETQESQKAQREKEAREEQEAGREARREAMADTGSEIEKELQREVLAESDKDTEEKAWLEAAAGIRPESPAFSRLKGEEDSSS